MTPTKARRRPTKEEPPPILEQVEHLDENVLRCRDFRHAWATDGPYYKVEVEGGVRNALYVERTVVCMRCETRRVELHRVHEHSLERLRSHYVYPEIYHIRGVKRSDRVQDLVRYTEYLRSGGAHEHIPEEESA